MPRDGDAASKVLFAAIDVFSRVGGIQRFNQRVLRCLEDLHKQGDLSYSVVTVRDERCPAGQRPEKFFGARGSKPRALAWSCRQLLLGRPDILLLGHVMLTPLAAVAKALVPGIETVLLVHGYEVWDDPQFGRVSWRDKWCVRHRVDRIVSVSRFTAGRMEAAFGLRGARFELLPNAVDPLPGPPTGVASSAVAVPRPPLGDDAPARLLADAASPGVAVPRSPLGDDVPERLLADAAGAAGRIPGLTPRGDQRPKRLLTVARLDELGKGVGGVLRALPGIIEAVGPVEYVVVGDGAKRPELEALARTCGVAGAVRFAGRVADDELARCYAESDAFVMPSLKEGFGIVYLEAWQHGLPVVAGNRDAGAEVVDDGINGLVVDPTSTPQIVGAVVRLLRSPDHARALGAAGRDKVRRECGHEPFHRRLKAILRRGGGAAEVERVTAPRRSGSEEPRPSGSGYSGSGYSGSGRTGSLTLAALWTSLQQGATRAADRLGRRRSTERGVGRRAAGASRPVSDVDDARTE